MDPLRLTEEQVAFLKDAFPELPCRGPDGAAAGYWVEAEQYRGLRALAYKELHRQADALAGRDETDPHRGEVPDWLRDCDSPAEAVRRMLERDDAAGAGERLEAA